MSTFKPGDRIRRIADPLANVPLGFETVVVERDPVSKAHDVVWFEWPGETRGKVHSPASAWELVTDKPKIEVGQRWRYVGATNEYYTKGTEYAVTELGGEVDDWFKLDDNKFGQHWHDNYEFRNAFELVTAKPAPQITVGSKWRFIKPTSTHFYTSGHVYEVVSEPDDGGMFRMSDNISSGARANHHWNARTFMEAFVPADAEEPALPVRTRTVTEIVPGKYAGFHVGANDAGRVHVVQGTEEMYTAAELRAAASVFTALADALEENK